MDQAVTVSANPNNTRPFDEIALSLSGGGYRAAAFHLGTLDMLHRLNLLQSVHVLSTVSGGTLTGLKYALSVTEGTSFEDFYRGFFDFLTSTNVIRDGLTGLKPPARSPFAGQMPSLIRSAAQVYASANMLGDSTFGRLLNDQTSHLREASFNATEFRTANYFRFQRSASSKARIGNGNLAIKRDVAEQIRLADIAAASSCFPSAFEPFRFPDDFLWPRSLDEIRAALGDSFNECVPLMDGGIYDNQGIDSIVRAYERGGDQYQIGLLIVSDTSQRDPSLFEFAPQKKRGLLTVSLLVKLAWLVFIIACITTVILIAAWLIAAFNGGFHWVQLFLYGVPVVLSSVLAGGLIWIRGQYREAQKRVSEMTTLELWPFLKRLTVPELIDLISGRAKSLIALTSSVFLKRIRALVYKDIKVHPSYLGREVTNLIYDLDDTTKFPKAIVNELAPTEELRELAKRAELMETTLWINDAEELRNLIACGQATTCFNILRHILHERRNELNTSGSQEEGIYKNALALWEVVKKDRYAFLRR
ncbi:MAG TPA: patatin-like phospholipase family protein [Pyrinomonadaceae bacterium]|nr:patatin-like phospholipase family protein [Pyrinomonadaceae bacterium]